MINKVDEVGSSGLIVLERRGAKTYLVECSSYVPRYVPFARGSFEFDVTTTPHSQMLKLCENDLWRKTR